MKLSDDNKISKGYRTAQRILDAAEALFARQGFKTTSLREIAEQAGLREPGLYNHFASKDVLYAAVLRRALQPMEDQITEIFENAASPADLVRLPVEMLRLNAAHPNMSALFYQAIQALHDGSAQSEAAKWLERLFLKGREINRRTIAADEETLLLQAVAMFNLCCGYLLAGPMIENITGRSVQDPELLSRQQQLMERVMRLFLVG